MYCSVLYQIIFCGKKFRFFFDCVSLEMCSCRYGEGSDDESHGNTNEDIDALNSQRKLTPMGPAAMKKPIELDEDGQPWGSMKDALHKDIQKYAKDLDPSCGWEGQSGKLQRNLLRRLYTGDYC